MVGAYRSDEVDAAHPLHALLAAVREKGLAAPALSLSPLGQAALSGMVADMLDRPVDDVEALSTLVKDKTDGSPFFVGQLLHALHEHHLLRRDPETGQWQWQREAIERAGITDNVIGLLTRRLSELSPALRRLLETAACIGNRFPLELLAYLEGQTEEPIRATLDEAVREGLVLHEGNATEEAYAFVHDRVQQAAYEARPPEERTKAHYFIGQKLRARHGTECADDELFVTLYHRNRAMDLVTSAEEKRDLAAQNLRAGQRAKTSTAYAEAVEFLSIGQRLLGEGGWTEAPALIFETHLALAEAMTLALGYEAGAPVFRTCLARAPDAIERARVASIWLPLHMVTGQFALGVEVGLDALGWLGRPLPRAPEEHPALLARLLAEVEPLLEQRTLDDWKALPRSAARDHQLACALLEPLIGLCGLALPSLSPCCALSIVIETLRHGLARHSLFDGAGLSDQAAPRAARGADGRIASRVSDAI